MSSSGSKKAAVAAAVALSFFVPALAAAQEDKKPRKPLKRVSSEQKSQASVGAGTPSAGTPSVRVGAQLRPQAEPRVVAPQPAAPAPQASPLTLSREDLTLEEMQR